MLGCQEIIRILACASTGKTTTLVEMCRSNWAIKLLLVVFNKTVELQFVPQGCQDHGEGDLDYVLHKLGEGGDDGAHPSHVYRWQENSKGTELLDFRHKKVAC